MSGSNFRSSPHSLLTSQIVNFLEFYSQERKCAPKRRPAPSPSTVSGLSAFIDSHFADATTANALNTCTVVLRKKKDNSLKNSPFDGVRLSNYRLRPADVPREVFDWVSHFLWLKNCPLELATIIATRVASRMSTETTSPISGGSELKPALASDSSESALAYSLSSGFTSDQPTDNIDFSYSPRSSGLPSALCSVDVARQSRDMVDDMLEEMAADPAHTVDMVLDYNGRTSGPALGWGDEEGEQNGTTTPVPASPKGFTSSLCAIKNGRKTMEDRHIIIHDLNKALGLTCSKQYSYYAIFDGHAGVDAATYSTAHLHHNLVNSAAFAEGRIEDAFQEAFEITDSLYVKRTKEDGVDQLKASGTTALCALIEDQKTVYLAWVGDSQAVLVRNGCHEEIMLPHKPEMDSERTRIQDLGGLVVFVDTWRVNGILSVTRAIGDPDHKPYINAEPSLAKFTIDSSLDFLVLGCDGLFDQLTGQDIASHVFEYLCKNEQKEPQEVISGVSTYLSQMAIREGSTDNITSIVLFFKPFEQLVATGYPIEGEMADVTVVDAGKTPSESADLQSMSVNSSLPAATNGGHFPYTDFSELPVGTNFNLYSMPPAVPTEEESDGKEDKEDAVSASVMKNPFEGGCEDSGFDFNGSASGAALDDTAALTSTHDHEQAASDGFESDANDDFTFTASATTETASSLVPPMESDFLPLDATHVNSTFASEYTPMQTFPMNTPTPVGSTPVDSAPPMTDWSQMDFIQQQSSSADMLDQHVQQEKYNPFASESKSTEETAPPAAVAADDWSQFEAPPAATQTQEPEHVQEDDIFKQETDASAAVPMNEWSQFETQSMPAETMQQTVEENVVQEVDTFSAVKQSDIEQASESTLVSHDLMETEEKPKEIEKAIFEPVDSTFDLNTYTAENSESSINPAPQPSEDHAFVVDSTEPSVVNPFAMEDVPDNVNVNLMDGQHVDVLTAQLNEVHLKQEETLVETADSTTDALVNFTDDSKVESSSVFDDKRIDLLESDLQSTKEENFGDTFEVEKINESTDLSTSAPVVMFDEFTESGNTDETTTTSHFDTEHIDEFNKVELVNSSAPFDIDHSIAAESKEDAVTLSAPIDIVPDSSAPVEIVSTQPVEPIDEIKIESLNTSSLDTTEAVVESKTEFASTPAQADNELKVDEVVVESAVVEEPKIDEPKIDEPKIDEPKVEESKAEEVVVEKANTEVSINEEPKVEPVVVPETAAETSSAVVPTKPKAPSAAAGLKKPLASAAGKASTLLSKAKPLTATSKVAAKTSTVAKTTTETKPTAIKRNVTTTNLTASRPVASKAAASTSSRPGLAKPSTTTASASRLTTRPTPSTTTSAASKVGSTRVGVTAKPAAPRTATGTTSTTARTTPAVPRAPISRLAPAKTTTQSTTAKTTTEAKPAIKRTVASSTATRPTTATAPKPAATRPGVPKTSPAPATSRLASARPTPPPGTSRLGTTRPATARPGTASSTTSKTAAAKPATTPNGTSNSMKAVPKKPAGSANATKAGGIGTSKPTPIAPTQANGAVKSYSAKRPMGVENSLKQELEDAVNGMNGGSSNIVIVQQQQSPPPSALPNGEEMNGINGHNGL